MKADAYQKLVAVAANGDAEAKDFVMMLIDIAQTWDDLIDGDKPVVAERIHRAFESALIWLPRNRFYQSHLGEFSTLLQNSIRNWQLANEIERRGESVLLPAAFVLRSAYADILAHVAYIMGGAELALTVGLEARRQAHAEGMDGYLTNLAAEKAARGR